MSIYVAKTVEASSAWGGISSEIEVSTCIFVRYKAHVNSPNKSKLGSPNEFDLIVAPNLYGDIITDLIAGLIGGLGMAPSANIGSDVAIFEAVHGSAPDIANKNIVNPTAFFLSGALMLDYLGETKKAEKLRYAIEKTLKEGKYLTKDLGGNQSTTEYTDRIISFLS